MTEVKHKKLTGTVTSDKSTQTVTVRVESIKLHPKYLKRYRISLKYHAHNELPDIKVGDKVVIEECRPYSKTVHWKVVSKQIT